MKKATLLALTCSLLALGACNRGNQDQLNEAQATNAQNLDELSNDAANVASEAAALENQAEQLNQEASALDNSTGPETPADENIQGM
jgi:peptidoglycan hydrolase CwlO-like protein